MRTMRKLAAPLILTVCIVPVALGQPANEPDSARAASRMLKITYSKNAIPVDAYALPQYLSGQFVERIAGVRYFNITEAEFDRIHRKIRLRWDVVHYASGPVPLSLVVVVHVRVEFPPELQLTGDPAGFIDACIRQIEVYLNGLVEFERESISGEVGRREAEMTKAHQELSVLRREQSELRQSAAGPIHLPLHDLYARITDCDKQLQDLELKIAGLQARKNAIAGQLQEVVDIQRHATTDDEISKELEKIVQLREKELRAVRAKAEANVVAASEVNAAEEQYALARIELLRHRRALAEAVGADQLQALNVKLSETTIELEETIAQRTSLGESPFHHSPQAIIEQAKRSVELLAAIEQAEEGLKKAESRFVASKQELANLQAVRIEPVEFDEVD